MAAKVSVIVPNYNHSRYLRQRIDSILNQTFQDFELILLDDKSTDDSVSVLNSYAGHPRVSAIVINEANSGSTFKQWKKGLALCKGRYVWIAESDDWADHRLLEVCVGAMEKDPEIALCQVGAHIVDSNGKEMPGNYGLDGNTDGGISTLDGKNFIRQYLRWQNYIYNASGVVFRRECVKQFPDAICNFRVSGDWMFWCGIAKCGRVAIVHEKLNYFRRHGANTSMTNYQKEDIRVFRWAVEQKFFEVGTHHSTWIKIGLVQRQIKHIKDEQERLACHKELESITGAKNKMPYYYMLLTRMADHVSPVCLFPLNKRWRRMH